MFEAAIAFSQWFKSGSTCFTGVRLKSREASARNCETAVGGITRLSELAGFDGLFATVSSSPHVLKRLRHFLRGFCAAGRLPDFAARPEEAQAGECSSLSVSERANQCTTEQSTRKYTHHDNRTDAAPARTGACS